jgi:hypothetical protein
MLLYLVRHQNVLITHAGGCKPDACCVDVVVVVVVVIVVVVVVVVVVFVVFCVSLLLLLVWFVVVVGPIICFVCMFDKFLVCMRACLCVCV